MASRTIPADLIRDQVVAGIGEIFCRRTAEATELLRRALDSETDELARDMLEAILQNQAEAVSSQLPLCQDTGLLVVFADLGCEALSGCLEHIIGEAALEAWQKFYLRDSIAPDPLRGRTLDRGESLPRPEPSGLPLILHLRQVPGNQLTLHLALKGGGAENCGAVKMFTPGASLEEIETFVVQTVVEAGGKACPPVFVGVGMGGDFETCAILAKRALFLPRENGPGLRQMEARLLDRINRSGKGVMGLGGATTALKVSVLTQPCHIASLPVAVNLDCHAHRSTTRVI